MDFPIEAKCSVLDKGIHVLITGGCLTHVGAVSWAFPEEDVNSVQFPAHKDKAVSEHWAEKLCGKFRVPAVVACGIHYDNIDRAKIPEIVDVSEDMLNLMLELIEGDREK